MGTKRRTEIIIETERAIIVSKSQNSAPAWCTACGAEVEMVSTTAMALAFTTSHNINQRTASDTLHVADKTAGTPLVCLNSLLRALKR